MWNKGFGSPPTLMLFFTAEHFIPSFFASGHWHKISFLFRLYLLPFSQINLCTSHPPIFVNLLKTDFSYKSWWSSSVLIKVITVTSYSKPCQYFHATWLWLLYILKVVNFICLTCTLLSWITPIVRSVLKTMIAIFKWLLFWQ